MPRNVRNFWFEAELPGRENVATGPRGKMERMTLKLYIRCNGVPKLAYVIRCIPFIGQSKNNISIFQVEGEKELFLHRMECDR